MHELLEREGSMDELVINRELIYELVDSGELDNELVERKGLVGRLIGGEWMKLWREKDWLP